MTKKSFYLKEYRKIAKILSHQKTHYTPHPPLKNVEKIRSLFMFMEEYTRMSTKRMYTCVHNASSVIKYTYWSMPGYLEHKSVINHVKKAPWGTTWIIYTHKKWLRSFPDISRVCSPNLVPKCSAVFEKVQDREILGLRY